MSGALPTFIVIGAMKCGTTVLHRLLGRHAEVAVSRPKELNYFFGAHTPPRDTVDPWADGNLWRGPAWYASHFASDAPVRGEASPGYTSPSHPEVAERMAAMLPDVRLVYLVRDPIARAVSQYRHHRRDGTERRPAAQALLDPASQYIARSRFHERLAPFLDRFPRGHVLIASSEDLRTRPASTVAAVLRFIGADPPSLPPASVPRPSRVTAPVLDPATTERLRERLSDDAQRLRRLAAREFAAWSV